MNINSGYIVEIDSWEGDADYPNTKRISGLTREAALFVATFFRGLAGELGFNLRAQVSNRGKELVRLWRHAEEIYPDAAKEFLFGVEVPTEEEADIVDKYVENNWTGPTSYRAEAFFDALYDGLIYNLLGPSSEHFCDTLHSYRAIETIRVFYTPCIIEDVSHQFIPKTERK